MEGRRAGVGYSTARIGETLRTRRARCPVAAASHGAGEFFSDASSTWRGEIVPVGFACGRQMIDPIRFGAGVRSHFPSRQICDSTFTVLAPMSRLQVGCLVGR